METKKEKKEIGIEKLIELLNEYNDNKEGTRIGFIKTIYTDGVPTPYELGKSDLLRWEDKIISKKFGFIKWLVENEKIKPLRKFIGWETDEDEPYIQFDLVDQYIAYLSISDTPIEDLISYLK